MSVRSRQVTRVGKYEASFAGAFLSAASLSSCSVSLSGRCRQPHSSGWWAPRPTYWKEGAIIGGALGVVGGAMIGHALCGLSEEATRSCVGSSVLGGLLGAAVLAVPGALIGGQVPKSSAEAELPE